LKGKKKTKKFNFKKKELINLKMVAECMEIDDYVQNIVIKLDSKDVSQVLRTIVDVRNIFSLSLFYLNRFLIKIDEKFDNRK
jgi:hypothetical protein